MVFLNRVLLILFAWSLCGGAQAQNVGDTKTDWQECGEPVTTLWNTAIPIDIGIDSQVGDVIGQWTSIAKIVWNCKHQTNQSAVKSAEAKLMTLPFGAGFPIWGIASGGRYNDAVLYPVYQIEQNGQKIGFIGAVAWGVSGSGDYKKYIMVNGWFQSEFDNIPLNANNIKYEMWFDIRMVKISEDFPTVNSSFFIDSFRKFVLSTQRKNYVWSYVGPGPDDYAWTETSQSWDEHAGVVNSPFSANVLSINGTCTSPSAQLDLGNISINALPNIGDPVGSDIKTTSVRFHNCAKNMAGIYYKLFPVGTGTFSSGVLNLISPSTAQNVGVQVFVKHYWATSHSPLNANQRFHVEYTNYPGSSGNRDNNYEYLYARMVRLDPGITPTAGTVHAALKVVATYH